METFKNTNFDITSITNSNGVYALGDVEQYLDFAVNQTIRKQLPNITISQEQNYAKKLLNNFFRGDLRAFTSSYNIRASINEIGYDKIFFTFVKAMIERHAFDLEVLHILKPTNEMQEMTQYVTENIKNGYFENLRPFLESNIGVLIENYVDMKYRIPSDQKDQYNALAYRNPTAARALEQLNLEMSLDRLGSRH